MLVDAPELVYASGFDDQALDAPAADLLGLLGVEADGAVVAISYGFSRDYAICNLRDQRLRDGWNSYMQRAQAGRVREVVMALPGVYGVRVRAQARTAGGSMWTAPEEASCAR
jgi:hypothetical protein